MVKREVERIFRDIKSVKIQGANNIAKAAVKAYSLSPRASTKKKLIGLRPTEPALVNALNFFDKADKKEILKHFSDAQEKIDQLVFRLVKNGMKIYTHCHSTNVVKALIYCKEKGKKFDVLNTETRPLYQGRKTARELAKSKIKVTSFVDSAMLQAIKKSDIIFLGADAILSKGVINKVGSAAIAELAKQRKKPVYIIADSWKFSPKNVKIEERDFHEVWEKAPKNVKIKNPAFALIKKQYIKSIVSEKGVLKYGDFLRKARKIVL
tara:strand:+ start:155 stop:952 length:798 start_codon:yes stop_codon:yes gene_type:complete